MGYKPKYAAKNRKQEPEVIRSPKPETKKQRPAKKPRSRAGNIAWMVLTAVLITGSIATIGCMLGKTSIYFYPVIQFAEWDVMRVITLISFALLLAVPMILDITGERKWQQLRLEI